MKKNTYIIATNRTCILPVAETLTIEEDNTIKLSHSPINTVSSVTLIDTKKRVMGDKYTTSDQLSNIEKTFTFDVNSGIITMPAGVTGRVFVTYTRKGTINKLIDNVLVEYTFRDVQNPRRITFLGHCEIIQVMVYKYLAYFLCDVGCGSINIFVRYPISKLFDEDKKKYNIPNDWDFLSEYYYKNPISFISYTKKERKDDIINEDEFKKIVSHDIKGLLTEELDVTLLDIETFNKNSPFQFISYNKDSISKKKFDIIYQPVDNKDFPLVNKPAGGLWACKYTPKEEWESNWDKYLTLFESGITGKRRSKRKVLFNLRSSSNIIVIDTYKDFIKLLDQFSIDNEELKDRRKISRYKISIQRQIDFVQLLVLGFDGIYLTENAQKEVCGTNIWKEKDIWHSTKDFDSYEKECLDHWSVESLLLFNNDCIKEKCNNKESKELNLN